MPSGTDTLDFGAFPGSCEATKTIAATGLVAATAKVEAWIFPKATADHSVGEHIVEKIKVSVGEIANDTFTVHGLNDSYEPGIPVDLLDGGGNALPQGGSTMLYGLFTFGWAWNN